MAKATKVKPSTSTVKFPKIKFAKAAAPEHRLCVLAIAAIVAGGAWVDLQRHPDAKPADNWQPAPSVEVNPSPEITLLAVPKKQGASVPTNRYASKAQCEAKAAADGSPPEVLETLCWGLSDEFD